MADEKKRTMITLWCCPTCSHTLYRRRQADGSPGQVCLPARGEAYRVVVPHGRRPGDCPGKHGGSAKGSMKTVEIVYVDQLKACLPGTPEAEYFALACEALMKLVRLLGLEVTKTVIRYVQHDVVQKVYVPRARRNIRALDRQATAWAGTPAANDRPAGPPRRGRGGKLAPLVRESWEADEAIGEGGTVAKLVKEEW